LKRPEVYVSTDIETDGPIPGPNSMLSFASVAYDEAGKTISMFTANLNTLPGASKDPETMAFWAANPKAWQATRFCLEEPQQAMERYSKWLLNLPGIPVFVGFPVTFDFMFVYWYLIKFTRGSPFSFSGLDIKTLAMAKLKRPFRECTKRRMPKKWFAECGPHTHVATEDAMEQGRLFFSILQDTETYVDGKPCSVPTTK
jgi:DNA polymerase III alpha subunit (gram-positive type)